MSIDKPIWFLLGFLANAIAWRLSTGNYEQIGYPSIIFVIVLVMIIIRK